MKRLIGSRIRRIILVIAIIWMLYMVFNRDDSNGTEYIPDNQMCLVNPYN